MQTPKRILKRVPNSRRAQSRTALSLSTAILSTFALVCVGALSVESVQAAPQSKMQFNKRTNPSRVSIPKSNIGVGLSSPYNSSAYRNSAVRNYSKGATVDFRSGSSARSRSSVNRNRNKGGVYLNVSPNRSGYRGGVSTFYRPTFGNGIFGSGVYGSGLYGTNIYSRNIYGTNIYRARPLGFSTGLQPYPNTYTIPTNNYRPTYPTGLSGTGSTARADLNGPASTKITNQFYAKIPTSASARNHQSRAEQAFKLGNYSQAADLAQVALSLDPNNGRLQLFASHTNFSIGNFTQAANHLSNATRALPADQWGAVVKGFRDFYGKNDYVSQTNRLSQRIATQPSADALTLRGYHYGSLGYAEAATVDFQQAISIDPNHALATRLLPVLGIAPQPVSPEDIQAPVPAILPVADDNNDIVPLNQPQANRTDDGIIRLVPQFTKEEVQTAVPVELVPAPVAEGHSIMLEGPSK